MRRSDSCLKLFGVSAYETLPARVDHDINLVGTRLASFRFPEPMLASLSERRRDSWRRAPRGWALSHLAFLLLITYLTAGLGFNRFNCLGSR
jgi:hypothetical protein